MYCMFCGRLCDYDETHTCIECKKIIDRTNERVRMLALLREVYPEIRTIRLREKVESIAGTPSN